MEFVVAGTADCDRFFGKVTHVMSNSLVPIESLLTGLTEPIRSLRTRPFDACDEPLDGADGPHRIGVTGFRLPFSILAVSMKFVRRSR